jgi:hypothetical protein
MLFLRNERRDGAVSPAGDLVAGCVLGDIFLDFITGNFLFLGRN